MLKLLIAGVLLAVRPCCFYGPILRSRFKRLGPIVRCPSGSSPRARQMIADFKITRYSHRTLIDRDRGVCEVDCSGFLVAVAQANFAKAPAANCDSP